jgi:hypothetical protein
VRWSAEVRELDPVISPRRRVRLGLQLTPAQIDGPVGRIYTCCVLRVPLALLAVIGAATYVAYPGASAARKASVASTVAAKGFRGKVLLPGPGLATVDQFSIKAPAWHALKIRDNEAQLPAGVRAVAVILRTKSRLDVTIAINNPSAGPTRAADDRPAPEYLNFQLFGQVSGPETGQLIDLGKPIELGCEGLIHIGNEIDAGGRDVQAGGYSYHETVTVQFDRDELAALLPPDVQPSPDEEVWDFAAYNAATHRTEPCKLGAPEGVEQVDAGDQ